VPFSDREEVALLLKEENDQDQCSCEEHERKGQHRYGENGPPDAEFFTPSVIGLNVFIEYSLDLVPDLFAHLLNALTLDWLICLSHKVYQLTGVSSGEPVG
jgi:hypothetical protein